MQSDDWAPLADEALLEKRIVQLGLQLAGTGLDARIDRLYSELTAKGLTFHPPCHIGDEWFVPVGIPAIFIPFFLVHERLRKLERKLILEVEGETEEAFMKLIRHEAAHAYAYAYQLYRKKKWQRVFGLTSFDETPQFYRPRPYSRSYVVHLDDAYAQSDPDEDFAETFAVWLTPDSNWRERYQGWKALEKLEYVDELLRSIAGKPPAHLPDYNPSDHHCLNVKLKTYYNKKRLLYEDAYPDFYDNDLRHLFPAPESDLHSRVGAAEWLRSQRKALLESICLWTGERKYSVNKLLARLIARCAELKLVVIPYDARQNMQVASYISTLVTHYRFTGKFKRHFPHS